MNCFVFVQLYIKYVVGVIDFSNFSLLMQKMWLAHRHIENNLAPVDLAKCHDLSRKLARKYDIQVKMGVKLHMRDGDPVKLMRTFWRG